MASSNRLACYLFFLTIILSVSCKDETNDPSENHIQLIKIEIGPYLLNLGTQSSNNTAPADKPLLIYFSEPVDISTIENAVHLTIGVSGEEVPLAFTFLDNNKTVSALPSTTLKGNTDYLLTILESLKGAQGQMFLTRAVEFSTVAGLLNVTAITINGNLAFNDRTITDIPVENPAIEILFSNPVDPSTVNEGTLTLTTGTAEHTPLDFSLSDGNVKVIVTPKEKLRDLTQYQLRIMDAVKGNAGEIFTSYLGSFYTAMDPVPDFPVISDEALLTLVQQQTFRYFWDFAHPSSGMARERNTSGNIVTSGGSGFGIMALIVGIERNFISRQQGIDHMDKILDFLEIADRFHGAWPHWMNGNTGDVVPFSPNDNGGDLVETSFLMQGLITFRQYLDANAETERILINRINALWHTVEWDWYTKGEHVLYWHWSPDKEWTMNHPVRGYNEALITYFLAAASPSHAIDAAVYHQGWAGNGAIVNNKSYYEITLPVGSAYGGPLFFSHYSFLGLDPRNLSDTYANYWDQNVNHSRINHAYALVNPKNYVGYSDVNWGLTASDNHQGYSAHSPTNDLGVITPSAALSSFPYTPDESMKALKFFYYAIGDRMWGPYGFYDAFNLTEGWTADSYLAIDQGPIIVMIENYRTGLLWNLFMSSPEVQVAMEGLEFSR